MKKYLLIFVGLILAAGSVSAQALDKEAQKALKAAQKEAEGLVKKARAKYQGSIADPQMGRKETDFTKMQEALDLSNAAIANEHNAQNKEAWHTAADIEYCYFKKLEDEVKADESRQPEFLASCKRLAEYSIKYYDLYNAEPKKNAEDFNKAKTLYQNYAVNSLIQLLQAAQVYSSSDKQEELKMCVEYSEFVVKGLSSELCKSFNAEQIAEWILYCKVFRAQGLVSVAGAAPADVEAAYGELVGSKFELVGYQALCNYFRESNPAKYEEYLKKGLAASEGKPEYAQLLFMLIQQQFQNKQMDECLKSIAIAKEKCADNPNIGNAYLFELQIYFEQEKYKEAEKAALDGLAAVPEDNRFLLMAARSSWMYYSRNSDDKSALDHTTELFKRLETENPDEPDLWGESLYILYNNSGQADKAKAYKKYYKEIK